MAARNCFLSIVSTFLCLAVAAAGEPGWPSARAFWMEAPSATPDTMLLYHGPSSSDGAGSKGEDLLEDSPAESGSAAPDELSLPAPTANKPGASAATGTCTLTGDAAMEEHGRFGPGVRLSGSGSLVTTGFFPKRFAAMHPQATTIKILTPFVVEFWIQPTTAAEQAILAIPFGDTTPFLLMRKADGTLLFRFMKQEATHPARVPENVWTHVVLRVGPHRAHHAPAEAVLTINGMQGPAAEIDYNALHAFYSSTKTGMVLGQVTGMAGFTGILDEIRISNTSEAFYPNQLADVANEQTNALPVADTEPYFVQSGPYVTSLTFDDTGTEAGVRGKAQAPLKAPMPLAPANLRQDSGSIEFWMRPINWDNAFHGGFMGEGIEKETLLRLTGTNGVALTITIRNGFSVTEESNLRDEIHPGVWRHVTVTWRNKKVAVYLDGHAQPTDFITAALTFPKAAKPAEKPVEKATPAQPAAGEVAKDEHTKAMTEKTASAEAPAPSAPAPAAPEFFTAGELCASSFVFDEFRIYGRTLETEEVKNAFLRYLPARTAEMKPLPPCGVTFKYFAHDWKPKERLVITIAALPLKGSYPAKADVTVFTQDGKAPVGTATDIPLDSFGSGNTTIWNTFDFGDWPATVTLKNADGTARGEFKTTYKRIRPDWYQNTLGKDRIVPKPWTNIVTDAASRTVTVWGRVITLGEGGLPQSITALGQPVTAAPARLVINGQPATASGFAFTETAIDRVEWKAAFAGAGVTGTLSAWLEYDGLLYYTATLAGGAKVDSLSIEFPLAKDSAWQLIANGGGGNFRASHDVRFLPEGTGVVWDSLQSRARKGGLAVTAGNFHPHIWLGNDDCGLYFGGENDKGWTPLADKPAQEILRDGATTTFRMNIIAAPVEVAANAPRTFTFMLLPTPMRPEPQGWRAWNRSKNTVHNSNYETVDDFCGASLKSRAGTMGGLTFELEPVSWEDAAVQFKAMKEKANGGPDRVVNGPNNPVFIYIDYSWPRFGPSFADWNNALWAGAGRMAWLPETEDYLVYTMNEYLKRGLIEGIYIDDVSVAITQSVKAQAYYLDEAKDKRQMGFGFMGFRRFCQRMWVLFEQKGVEPNIIPHMTWCFELPAFSFCMATFNGEDRVYHPFSKADSIDMWRAEELRIMGNAPKWGFATFWKPGIEKVDGLSKVHLAWQYPKSRSLNAIMMPHDLNFLYAWPAAMEQWPSYVDFGLEDPSLSFLPYWKSKGIIDVVTPDAKGIITGAFIRNDRCMLMVSNLDAEQTVTVKVDPAKLFGRAVKGITWKDIDPNPVAPEDLSKVAAPKTDSAGNSAKESKGEDTSDDLDAADTEAAIEAGAVPGGLPAIEAKDNTVTCLIRRHDFRLLQLTPVE